MEIELQHPRLWGDQGDGWYQNPILNSDYSDPDIIRVKDKYYMITSTLHLCPGMQLLVSRDLVHWSTVCSIIQNLEELDPGFGWQKMDPELFGRGVYAGSLRYLEWQEEGIPRSRWFMHTTLFGAGMVVSTAEQPEGPWETTFMKDRLGRELRAKYWDDCCPYWEWNEDGSLKEAFMVASKPHSPCQGWFLHMFRMSPDGKTLLDGDLDFMEQPGDYTRMRSGKTPDWVLEKSGILSGDPEGGQILHRETGVPIAASTGTRDAHRAEMDPAGGLSSILYAGHLPGREGTAIRDLISAEAAKMIRFSSETQIGNSCFSGRHGKNERVCDYVYIFNSEVWENGFRIPVLHRAKSVYGDLFDDSGRYLGPGSPECPGRYETQRLLLNTTAPFDCRQPNQGGFVDVPSALSEDGLEHWYFLTHHGNEHAGPECRPVSLLPVTWVEGWPIPGEILSREKSPGRPDPEASAYDGTGLEGNIDDTRHHPDQPYLPGVMQWRVKKPPIGDMHALKTEFQGSDDFWGSELSPKWLWQFSPRPDAWSLTQRQGFLRLYGFETRDQTGNFFAVRNVLSQKYVNSPIAEITVSLDCRNMLPGQYAGLAHFNGGRDSDRIAVHCTGQDSYEICGAETPFACLGGNGAFALRSLVTENGQGEKISRFFYRTEGEAHWKALPGSYRLCPGGYRGGCIGLFTYHNGQSAPMGYVDFSEFEYQF